MTAIKAFIERHSVTTYFALTFVISWGGILIVVGPGGIPGTREEFERLLPVVILAMLAGPSVAGILLTGLVHGRTAFRELLSQLLKWQVSARWYAFALLTAPLLFTAIPLALSLLFPEFLPGIFTTDDKASLLLLGIAAGLGAGIFEELGWTGFDIPRLRLRYGVLPTGLIVGVLWGENAIRYYDPDHSEGEDRFIMLGMSFKLRVLVVCHCYRLDDKIIRIVSARKANKKEADVYWR